MLENLSFTTFNPLIGETFVVVVDDRHAFEVRLTAVTPWGTERGSRGQRTPFTLLFHAPAEAQVPQRTYRILSDHLPPLELFLVPLGSDAEGMRYEAVFT